MPKILYSNISDGNMALDWGEKEQVLINRRKFFKTHNIDAEDLVMMNCTDHGEKYSVVEPADAGRGVFESQSAPKVDALITTTQGLGLVLLTADCYPVVIYNRDSTVLSLIHQGWRGVDHELISRVVSEMRNLKPQSMTSFIVKVGPGIAKKSYVVDSPSQIIDPRWQPFLKRVKDNKYSIDLPSFIKVQCVELGILEENIHPSNLDTASDKTQFSHYRSSRTGQIEGRFMTIASL